MIYHNLLGYQLIFFFFVDFIRDIFYEAEKHIYELMKKNSYPRFEQSDQYKELLANAIIPAPKRKYDINFFFIIYLYNLKSFIQLK